MLRPRYLRVVHNSDPIVKMLFKSSITILMKNSFPPNKKLSRCVHNIPLNQLLNTTRSDFQNFAPKFISLFLIIIYHNLEESFRSAKH